VTSNHSSPDRSARSTSGRSARLDRLGRLTARDHVLLSWLAEHYVLSTDQIATALFPSRRMARLRLSTLHRLEAVSRFVDVTTGDRQYLYTLGPLGAVVYPTQFNDHSRPDARMPRTSIERTIGSRRLAHLLGTNQLFIDLVGYARTDAHARLARRWPEQHTTAVYARSGIQPDGHGVWVAAGRQVGFFPEHDRGTEFSEGQGPCRSPDLRICAAQRLMRRRYSSRQVWCTRSGRTPLVRVADAGIATVHEGRRYGRRSYGGHGSSVLGGWTRLCGGGALSRHFDGADEESAVLRGWSPCCGAAWGRCARPCRDRPRNRLLRCGRAAAQGRCRCGGPRPRKTLRGLRCGGGNHA
jgi:hypothetical protein